MQLLSLNRYISTHLPHTDPCYRKGKKKQENKMVELVTVKQGLYTMRACSAHQGLDHATNVALAKTNVALAVL